MPKTKKLYIADPDDDFEFEDDDELEEGSVHPTELTGPSHTPVFTGLLNSNGEPILRHPVVIRFGFQLPENAYCAPTTEDDIEEEAVVGWQYEI